MSGFSISNRPQVGVNKQPLTPAQQSRDVLAGYRTHLGSGENVKSGVIHISTRGGEQKLVRDRAFHLRSRGGAGFGQAAEQIKGHFQKAFEGKVSPDALKGLMAGLDSYLAARGNQLGTKTFAKLYDQFVQEEGKFAQSQDAGGRLLMAGASDRLMVKQPQMAQVDGPQERQHQRDSGAEPQIGGAQVLKGEGKRVQQAKGLADALTVSEPKFLGAGEHANAFEISRPNTKGTVIVADSSGSPPELTAKSFNSGEIGAAAAQSKMLRVAKPLTFFLEVSRELNTQVSHRSGDDSRVAVAAAIKDTYEVPAGEVQKFVAAQTQAGATVKQLAVEMPLGAGSTLRKAFEAAPPTAAQFDQMGAGLYLACTEMHEAGVLHNDIKPANVMFDPASGKVMVVDLGSAEFAGASCKTQKVGSMAGRSEAYTHPSLQDVGRYFSVEGDAFVPNVGGINGHEADRYALGMSMLSTLAPDLEKIPVSVLKQASAQAYAAVLAEPDGNRGSAWLEGLMQALPAAAASVNTGAENQAAVAQQVDGVVAQLGTAFAANPRARDIVEGILWSAIPGPSGARAWNELPKLLIEGQDLSKADQKRLDHWVKTNEAIRTGYLYPDISEASQSTSLYFPRGRSLGDSFGQSAPSNDVSSASSFQPPPVGFGGGVPMGDGRGVGGLGDGMDSSVGSPSQFAPGSIPNSQQQALDGLLDPFRQGDQNDLEGNYDLGSRTDSFSSQQ